jgi:glycosyltransferase involved in cell wall biosynthesis
MKVQIVDPPAYTPPYDRSLCAALVRAGAEVELVTSRFAHGPVAPADGYVVSEAFYRRFGSSGGRWGRALKALQHVGDMARFRRHARDADVVHYQWLTAPSLDFRLLPKGSPAVLTPHGWLRREARGARGKRGFRRLLDRMDALVALSEFGARQLREGWGVDPARIRVIPHGVFDYLTRLRDEAPLPDELAGVESPVVLYFGLIRPYKGVDVLLEAFRSVEDAELWIVGRPLGMALAPLRELAARSGGKVRFVPRFVPDCELPAYFRRADLVVLPHRDAEQSGVLYTALAFEKPIVMTDVGGFGEVAARGAGRVVPPEDATALAVAINEILANADARERLSEGARAAASGPYSWDSVARLTLSLYRELIEDAR